MQCVDHGRFRMKYVRMAEQKVSVNFGRLSLRTLWNSQCGIVFHKGTGKSNSDYNLSQAIIWAETENLDLKWTE